jgi:cytochrome b pre-mRNA-processing protein 3
MQQALKAGRPPGDRMILQRLFGRERAANRQIADDLYGSIVAAARQEQLYSLWNVPDSPLGRFEMLSLHMFLLQRRLSREQDGARQLAQVLIDDFFTDVEHSLRELGIGDLGVPKRMKKLAKMHYGRTSSYDQAILARDREALSAALARNVRPDVPAWPEAAAVADYVLQADAALAAQPTGDILSGKIEFPVSGAPEKGGDDDQPH